MPSTLEKETIREMKTAGFKTLNLSLGTVSVQQQRRFNRPDLREAFDQTLAQARRYDLNAVGYIIIGAPGQRAEESLADLLYLARREVLAGISVFYPAPGSSCWTHCLEQGFLPKSESLMRSSALPLEQGTSRLEAVTLLRLGRILNYMKSLLDMGIAVSEMAAIPADFPIGFDRGQAGKYLLSRFLSTGEILGITSDGDLYPHAIEKALAEKFIRSLASRGAKGYRGIQ